MLIKLKKAIYLKKIFSLFQFFWRRKKNTGYLSFTHRRNLSRSVLTESLRREGLPKTYSKANEAI